MPDPTHPYDRPSDPAKRHSAALTDGPDRAGARSMLKAVGFTDEDLAKPLIGVATTWIETMPCNINQRRLAEFVKEGIRARRRHADGVRDRLGQRRRDDGHRGDEGVADQPRGRRRLDRAGRPRPPARRRRVPRSGCDKTTPGAAMALGRLDVPGLILYNGTIYPGTYKGQRNATVVSVYEAIGAVPGRQDHARRPVRDRERRMPGRGRLRRPVHREHDEHGDGVPRHQPRPGSTASRPRTRPRTRPPGAAASW